MPLLVSLANRLPACENLEQLAVELGQSLNPLLGSTRLALGVPGSGHWKLVGVSDTADFDRASGVVRQLQSELNRSPDHRKQVEGPAGDDPSSTFLTVEPVPGKLRLALQWEQGELPGPQQPGQILAPLAPLLTLWLQGRRSSISRLAGVSIRGGLLVSLLLAAALLLAWLPASFRTSAPAHLEAARLQVLTAPFDGFVEQGLARAGDSLKKGQLIARLEGRELSLELDNAASRVEELAREYRKALASLETAQPRVLQAQLEQARARRDLLQSQLERLELLAPFDGILISGDLSQSIGTPVKKGDVLFELAPDGEQRLVLEVGESGIRHLQPSQSVRLRLDALPGVELAARISRILPVAVPGEEGYYYRVEADLLAPPPGLRPGMQGLAKVEVGERSMLWVLLHPFIEWLQRGYARWLPW